MGGGQQGHVPPPSFHKLLYKTVPPPNQKVFPTPVICKSFLLNYCYDLKFIFSCLLGTAKIASYHIRTISKSTLF